ncbi:MAG: SpoVA/SpoVAEb family sporulation membrane protein [Clostridia bacterium]|nr:SpoVA/SpoVAEb family sporulation membrane protein [Clostridia bacterium]MDY4083697.1 SpoVA/SpoVAEb family sporulation membrane protein [Eubacteriales bacterium]
MENVLLYLRVFLVGGVVCLIGQILINKTKITSARILVSFLLLGAVLEAVGLFKYIEEFGKAGITVPIVGFGSSLVKGAIEGAKEGLLQACTGGMAAVSGGLTAAIVFGFIFALIFKSHPNKR